MMNQLDGVTVAYVALGSNLGDRAGNLLLAVQGADGGELSREQAVAGL